MKKKNYMKPATTVVQLQHRQQILAGSYIGIQTTSSDNNGPDYDGNSIGIIWDAN